MNALQRLLGYARPYRGRFVAALAAMAIYAVANAGITYQIKPLIDQVLGGGMAFTFFATVVIGGYIVKGIGGYFSVYLMTDIGQRVVRDIRNQLFRHMLDQSAGFFARNSSGALLSRITNDVNQVQQAVSETLGDLLREGLSLIGIGAILFYMDWQLALVVVFIAPLAIHPLVQLGKRIRRTTRRSQEELERLTHVTAEAFTGHRIVKAFGAEAHEEGRFQRAAQQVYRTNLKVTSTLAILPSLMELLGGVAVVLLIWYGSTQIRAEALTSGEFVLFVVAAFMMYTPVKKLSRVNASIQQAMAASERIFEVLDTHSEVRERPNAIALPPLRHGIEFQHVAFAYEDRPEKSILRDVSFRVDAGEMVAIVGLSGAGKTTLVNLLPRFYDVTAGAIRIDGIDIREVTLKSLRSQIGMVTQETVLFDETIASNIAYGSPGVSAEEIEAAARAAHAHEFIMNLPRRYQTRIAERGQKLSGGQRQRLAIARALLKNSPILILDEATSSLDAESELLVQDALQTLMRDRTSFVIAHRLSTVRRADKIIVLEKGRIVETGRHDDLLARPGSVYSKLYALQAIEPPRPGQVPPHPTIQ
ncbi:MAG TPA: lipid A export permease/ATP-binding protein MsbA [Vicinamibacterales bacterium]|nr:lipid A export permease/ATP-binding protein MsbA [Vicinamibacterales bacterium]